MTLGKSPFSSAFLATRASLGVPSLQPLQIGPRFGGVSRAIRREAPQSLYLASVTNLLRTRPLGSGTLVLCATVVGLVGFPAVAQERILLPENHVGTVTAASFSDTGEWLATLASDDTARIWHVPTRTVFRTFELDPRNWPVAIAISPDGARVALGWRRGEMEVRRRDDGLTESRIVPPTGDVEWLLSIRPEGDEFIGYGLGSNCRYPATRSPAAPAAICTGTPRPPEGVAPVVANAAYAVTRYLPDGSYELVAGRLADGPPKPILGGLKLGAYWTLAPGPDGVAFFQAKELRFVDWRGAPRKLDVGPGEVRAAIWRSRDLLVLRVDGRDRRTFVDVYRNAGGARTTVELLVSADKSPLAARGWASPDGKTIALDGIEFVDLSTRRISFPGARRVGGILSPDGTRLYLRGGDAEVLGADLEGMRPLGTGDSTTTLESVVSSADATVVFGHDYQTVYAFDSVTRCEIGEFRGSEPVAALTATGQRALVLWKGGQMTEWDPFFGGRREFHPSFKDGSSLSVSSDGTTAAAVRPGEIQLWSLAKDRLISTLKADGTVTAATFSPAGSTLAVTTRASIGKSMPLELIDARTGDRQATLSPIAGGFTHVSACPDGFVVVGADNVVRRLGRSGEVVWTTSVATGARQLSADRRCERVAVVEMTGAVRLLSGKDAGEEARVMRIGEGWVVVTPDGRYDGNEAGIAALRTATLPPMPLAGRAKQIRGLASMILGGAAKTSAASSKPEVVPQVGDFGGVHKLELSRNGRMLVLASGLQDGAVIRLWDMESGKLVRTFHQNAAGLALSPDGSRMAVGDGHHVFLWDTISGERKGDVEGIGPVAFVPDGRRLAVATYDEMVFYDLEGLNPERTIRVGDLGASALSFSADGRRFAALGGGGQVQTFETETGRRLGTAAGHDPSDGINSNIVEVSPDGKLVATSDGFHVHVFDVSSGRKICSPFGGSQHSHHETLDALSFSVDGKLLLGALNAGGPSVGAVVVWRASDGAELRRFKAPYASSHLAVSPEGRTFIAASFYGTGRFDLQSGARLDTLGRRFDVPVAADPSSLAIGIARGSGWIWEAAHGTRLLGAPLGAPWYAPPPGLLPTRGAEHVAFSGDGSKVAFAANADLVVHDRGTGRELLRLGIGPGSAGGHGPFSPFALNQEGTLLACTTMEGTVELWDVRQHRLAHLVHLLPQDKFVHVNELVFSGNGVALAVAISTQERAIVLARVTDGRVLWSAPSRGVLGGSSLAFSPDGAALVAADGTDRPMIFAAKTGSLVGPLIGHGAQICQVAWMPDGRRLLTGGRDGRIVMFDAVSRRPIRVVDAHGDAVTTLSFIDKGKTLFTTSEDRTIKLWRLDDSNQPIATLLFDENEFIVVARNGAYLSTRGALGAVGFRLDGRAYPVEQFDLLLNDPAFVLKEIGASSPELLSLLDTARRGRLERMHVDIGALRFDKALPTVKVATEPNSVVDAADVALTLRAADPAGALSRVHIFVDDVPLYGSAGRLLSGATSNIEVKVPLLPGPNKIQASVTNHAGQESLKVTRIVQSIRAPAPRTLHVVAVGTSHYDDSARDLKLAAHDAQDIAAHFLGARQFGFADVKEHVLVDKQVNRESVRQMRSVLEKTLPQDTVVIFFAGHGLLAKNGQFYYGTSDINFDRPSEKGLPFEEIEGLADGIPAREKLILVDACHSGEATDPDALKRARQIAGAGNERGFQLEEDVRKQPVLDLSPELFADLRRGSGAMAIAAAAAPEAAYESEEVGNGYFTRAVLEGLRDAKADVSGDHKVQVSELRQFVVDRVTQLSKGRQTPTVRRENLARDFVVP